MFWKLITVTDKGCVKMNAKPAIGSCRDSVWRNVCILGIVLIGLCSIKAFAQTDQGAIIGVVTDSTGAVIPNAEVTLTNVDNGLVRKTKSNADGNEPNF